ncbi:MAG: hypothetical protein Kow0020_12520 [Wenzhouxiangellaceae bacterium]
MSRDYPDWVSVDRAADGKRRFTGRMALANFERLVDLLDHPEAGDCIEFEMQFWRDSDGTARLDLRVWGRLPLTCQRSLKRYLQAIDSRAELAVVADEDAIAALSPDLEPKIAADGRLTLAELVEDELLLALPLVPKDPAQPPVVDVQVGGGQRPDKKAGGAFAALESLRRRSD